MKQLGNCSECGRLTAAKSGFCVLCRKHRTNVKKRKERTFDCFIVQAEVCWTTPKYALPPEDTECVGFWDDPTGGWIQFFTRTGGEYYFKGEGNTHFTLLPHYWTRSLPNIFKPLHQIPLVQK